MRTALALALGVLGLLRLGAWREGHQTTLDLCARLEQRRNLREYSSFVGDVAAREDGLFSLEDVVWEEGGRRIPVGAPLSLEVGLAKAGLGTGRKIRVFGPVRCRRPPRNPSGGGRGSPRFLASGKDFRSESTAEPMGWGARFRENFRARVNRSLLGFPGLRALAIATWTGDAGALPENLRRLYLEGGLLHILALSGQHVAVLAAMAALFLRAVVPLVARLGPRFVVVIAELGRSRVLASALVLTVAADGLAPLRRALGMIFGWELLNRRSFHVGTLALVSATAAALLLGDPGLLGSASFFLSVGATACLARLNSPEGMLRQYGRMAWAMPLLTAPLSAYYFGKLAWLAPVWNFILGGIWGLVWLPLGFLAPGLGRVFPGSLTPWAEWGWQGFVALQERVSDWGPVAYRAVVRPWGVEAVAWETLLVIALLPWLTRGRRSRGSIP